MSKENKPEIFDYLDHKQFLKAAYEFQKDKHRGFTHQVIAQQLGLQSTGYFSLLLQGKKNISGRLLEGLAEIFKLKKKEAEYFELLVSFHQSKLPNQKKKFFDRIISLRKKKKKIIGEKQYEFYNKWFYSVIRQIIAIYPFSGDFKKLANSVIPKISIGEAKEAMEVLEKIGLIQKLESGSFRVNSPVISTGDEWQSAAIHNVQMEMVDLGRDALTRFPKNERDVSNLTVTLSGKAFEMVQKKLKQTREEILEIARNNLEADMIYQCNFQVFPVFSKPQGAKPRLLTLRNKVPNNETLRFV